MPLLVCYDGKSSKHAGEGKRIRFKAVSFHLNEEIECSVAIIPVRICGDHGIVTDGVTDREWGGIEELLGEFDVTGGRICGKNGGSSDDVWFGNFIEQFASISDVRGFAVDVDETVEDESVWYETGGEYVCMDGACDGLSGGSVVELG
jgi:hypothetical protein